MSVDRLLTTVLGLYRDVHDEVKTQQIFNTTTTLLTHLHNPLNLTLLTSNLLTAPAIWHRPDPLATCYRVISIYHTAARHIYKSERDRSRSTPPTPSAQTGGGGVATETWVRAVVKGADDRSPRWKHLLVLAGILTGLEAGGEDAMSHGLKHLLEGAIVTAANLALGELPKESEPLPTGALALSLTYTFHMLSESSRASINCNLLAPVAAAALLGEAGLSGGLFLGAIDVDVRQTGEQFVWSEHSPSFLHLRQLMAKPLVSSMGALVKIIAYAVGHPNAQPTKVLRLQDDLVAFTQRLLQQWQANKLSELEPSEAHVYLTHETLRTTWPVLWQLLKKITFAGVTVLHAITQRSLLDGYFKSAGVTAPLAVKSLNIFRSLSFISSPHASEFQIYKFTYLASIDTLVQFPEACSAFLQSIKRPDSGVIPAHPLDRTLDLCYLSFAEHLPLNLPPEACDALIVQPAMAYLTQAAPVSGRMVELFESAHSAILSVLSCPHNGDLIVKLAPFYSETLFTSFPKHISPRQFRLAFKTMIQILSPPFPIAATHPNFAETLLEMVRFRITAANPAPLPPGPDAAAGREDAAGPVSEQSTLVMTLIDSLPFLPLHMVEDWMTWAAESLNEIQDRAMREVAQRRYVEILDSGEMDVERAAIGVAWWGSKGGRQLVLFGGPGKPSDQQQFMMSGAIVEEGSKL
ncbi:Peroxisomal membrane protein PEX17 [Coniochaeta hoffmannii]|uniref:Peroxisomal membrane protein PEX17 n=1 Tax=Coniochaeta hoffmannii TaxID=91930 RepID=A0AA38W135_9PEZI|nr:Peroxisomal membrane protein PEX17 [Coniochaeta hoffmannii]